MGLFKWRQTWQIGWISKTLCIMPRGQGMQLCVHSFTLDAIVEGSISLSNHKLFWYGTLLIASNYAAPFWLERRLIQRRSLSKAHCHAPCDTCIYLSSKVLACKAWCWDSLHTTLWTWWLQIHNGFLCCSDGLAWADSSINTNGKATPKASPKKHTSKEHASPISSPSQRAAFKPTSPVCL